MKDHLWDLGLYRSEKSKASIEEEFFDGLVYQLNTPGNNLGKPAAEHNDASYHSFIILDICVIVEVLIRRLPRLICLAGQY
ncbi:hypothetical protein ARSEF1564_007216 [Beauveria bassiana]